MVWKERGENGLGTRSVSPAPCSSMSALLTLSKLPPHSQAFGAHVGLSGTRLAGKVPVTFDWATSAIGCVKGTLAIRSLDSMALQRLCDSSFTTDLSEALWAAHLRTEVSPHPQASLPHLTEPSAEFCTSLDHGLSPQP